MKTGPLPNTAYMNILLAKASCSQYEEIVKTKDCYYYSRGGSYNHLFNDEILLKKLNKPIFQSIK